MKDNRIKSEAEIIKLSDFVGDFTRKYGRKPSHIFVDHKPEEGGIIYTLVEHVEVNQEIMGACIVIDGRAERYSKVDAVPLPSVTLPVLEGAYQVAVEMDLLKKELQARLDSSLKAQLDALNKIKAKVEEIGNQAREAAKE